MKRSHLFWQVLCCSLMFRLDTVLAEGILTAEQLEAEAIVNSYCDALINGDVNGIRPLLGNEYLKQKLQLLENPTYPGFLRERYSNARCELFDNKLVNENKVEISVNVILNENEIIKSRFLLMKDDNTYNPQFRIYEETAE